MLIDQWAASQRLQDTFYGYSAAEIEAMPMDAYRAIRRRAGLPDVDPYTDAYAKYEPPGQEPASAPRMPQERHRARPRAWTSARWTCRPTRSFAPR